MVSHLYILQRGMGDLKLLKFCFLPAELIQIHKIIPAGLLFIWQLKEGILQ